MDLCVALRLELGIFSPAQASSQARPGGWSEGVVSPQCGRCSRGSEERETVRRGSVLKVSLPGSRRETEEAQRSNAGHRQRS
jgi:hypothetical protein